MKATYKGCHDSNETMLYQTGTNEILVSQYHECSIINPLLGNSISSRTETDCLAVIDANM